MFFNSLTSMKNVALLQRRNIYSLKTLNFASRDYELQSEVQENGELLRMPKYRKSG